MKHRTAATVVLMVAMLMDLMDSTITNVALPTIGADLGATPAQLEWTLAGYVVAFATLLITAGRLGDIYGRKLIFVIGVTGFTITSAVASLAWSGDVLILTRVIQGAFAGVMVPQVLSSIQVMYTPEERGPILGLAGSLTAIGAITGLLVGGWLVTANFFGAGWRSIFLINIPVGIVLVVAALLCMSESRSEHPLQLDLTGASLGTLAVVLLVLPLTEGRAAGWAWWIWAMLIAAPAAIAVFIWQQRRRAAGAGAQLLPLPLFRIRSFSSGLLVQVLSSMGHGGYSLILLFHMQYAFGFTPFSAGLTLLPLAIGSIIGAPIAIVLMRHLGKWAVLLGGLMQALAFAWAMLMIQNADVSFSNWTLLPAMAFAGVGMMILIMPQTSIALSEIPPTEAGAASGTLTTFAQAGMVLGIALAGTAYFGAQETSHDVTAGLWVIVLAYLFSGIAALTMPTISLKGQGQTSPEAVTERQENVVT